ncbi:hypothetical protein [Cupriavidus pauculus]|uniref:hypothetical protein n=1 Tax=Cupriavidus pauculus TaxID=82633 RepID=UPI001EE2FB19|nr:hypothetical protein [Cupriavidus pauculus]GJG97612.1 hypothetical protein CBA19C6_24005 [Cupriavidus pauculus]
MLCQYGIKRFTPGIHVLHEKHEAGIDKGRARPVAQPDQRRALASTNVADKSAMSQHLHKKIHFAF